MIKKGYLVSFIGRENIKPIMSFLFMVMAGFKIVFNVEKLHFGLIFGKNSMRYGR